MTETKIEPTQTKSRAQRETRANKKLIVTRVKAKGISKDGQHQDGQGAGGPWRNSPRPA
ncbi:hypothetical protein ABIB99_008854 [Bradyrhizobium sp. LA6.1]